MARILALLLVHLGCATAFAVDQYTVATIQCPANVMAALNWADKAGYDVKFRVEAGLRLIAFRPLAIEWNGKGETPQTIFCRYRQSTPADDFKGRYVYKLDFDADSCRRESSVSWTCARGVRIACPTTHADLNWVNKAGSDPTLKVQTGTQRIDFEPVYADRVGQTFFCDYKWNKRPPDIQGTYAYKVHRHIIDCTKENNITLACMVKP